jgi:hypothetical protein
MNKYNRINIYKKRAETFSRRTISMLEKIDFNADYTAEVNEFHTKLSEAGYNEDAVAEYAIDFSASLADEYMLMSDGIYSAVLTSFYHLWERDIKDLCKRMLLYNPVTDGQKRVTEQIIQNYKYDKLKDVVIFWGADESIFEDINLLRLVVNTIKHSAGSSAEDLLNCNIKYYYKLSILCDLKNIDYDKESVEYMLDIDDLKYFGACVTKFWDELGSKILL